MQGIEPKDYPMGRHNIVQVHERSGRRNLYIANHLHHLEYPDGTWVEEKEGTELIEELLSHATQEKYVVSVEWKEAGDLVIWDNTAVMVSTLDVFHIASGSPTQTRLAEKDKHLFRLSDACSNWSNSIEQQEGRLWESSRGI